MSYRLEIEEDAGGHPPIITDIVEYLGFEREETHSGNGPTITLPPVYDKEFDIQRRQLIGWQWPMGGKHTICLHNPEINMAYWITQERMIRQPKGLVERVVAFFLGEEYFEGLHVSPYSADESKFKSAVDGRVYLGNGDNYILVEGKPSDLINDVLKHVEKQQVL